MNRAQRRQLGRAIRRSAKHPQPQVAATEVDDTAARRNARAHGLVVPPSAGELEAVRRTRVG